MLSKDNILDLSNKSFCVIKNFLNSQQLNLIKEDFNLIKDEKFLNSNFNIIPVGKKIDLKKVFRDTIDPLSEDIQNNIDIKSDYTPTPTYFSIRHGINFGYHQDHESWFLYKDHKNYLNIWVPILKPDPALSNVVVINFEKLFRDHPELIFLKNYGATRFESGSPSRMVDDNTGIVTEFNFNLEEYAECPHLDAGDALVMRGDCIHRTQDTLTDRVAISVRRMFSQSVVQKSNFEPTSPYKKEIIENNPALYQKILSKFGDRSECTIKDLLEL